MVCTCNMRLRPFKRIDVDLGIKNVLAANSADISIIGRGVQIVFDAENHKMILYRLEGSKQIQMSKESIMGYPIVDGQPVLDFTDYMCSIRQGISGLMGTGEQMVITSRSASTGLTRVYIVETAYTQKGLIYTQTTYQAEKEIKAERFVESVFELHDPGDIVWSFNGGGEGPTTFYDQLQKIDLTTPEKFSRENRQDQTAAGLPVADIYNADGGITVGDASATRREVHTPVEETEGSVQISAKWPGKIIATDQPTDAGQTFITVHAGDYYNGLRGYKLAMEHLGIVMQTRIPESSYDLRWEGWGWGFDWTVDLIIKELDFLQKSGVKQITIDDAWYDHAGDWQLNPEKFPNGEEDMIRLVDAIHAHGMTALLWWRPCDGGRDGSRLYREHPEYFIMHEDGSTAKIGGPGKIDTSDWCQTAGYALCPCCEGAIESTVDFINRAMRRWKFDGFKGDFVWSLSKCYNPAHHHVRPEESTERQTEFYRRAHEAMVANNPDVFNLLCNCGAPQDFYGLQYMTQVVTADPTSLDQTRTRVKAYKALMGDKYPITTDHCQVWYSTTVGTGSVIIEKTAFTGAEADEYARWLGIANREQLHKGRFIGDLYSYGFDPYETYVVEKDGVMHYAFYRDGRRYRPDGYPDIELKGLNPDKMYRIVDYVNNRVVATNLMGDNAVFNTRFAKDLLVKAIEIAQPDLDPVDEDWGFNVLSANDSALKYEGMWTVDARNGRSCASTNTEESTMQLKFAGTAVRWYGRKTAKPGTADVYLDGKLITTVNTGGCEEATTRLFEVLDIAPAIHTLKIVNKSGIVNIDWVAVEPAIPEPVYEELDPLSERIRYGGNWCVEENAASRFGHEKVTDDSQATAELEFVGTAIRWIGKRVLEQYAVALVYLDGEYVDTVYNYGENENGKLLFERTHLAPGKHTLRIVQSMHKIDIETLAIGTDPE